MSAKPTRFGQSARDVAQVARFELLESVRTRRVMTLVLLFLVAGSFSAYGFARFLGQAESMAATALSAPASARPGASLEKIRKLEPYRKLMGELADDPDAASSLAEMPPLSLAFAWLMMTFLPLLALMTSADAISSEVESGALRYVLLRTGRLEYVLGKLAGHVALMAAVLALSAMAFLVVSTFALVGFPIAQTAMAMARSLPALVVHALPYVGIAFAGSMVASTAQAGRLLAIAFAVGLAILDGIAGAEMLRHGSVLPALFELLDHLTPAPRGYGMLAPIGPVLAKAMAVCFGTATLYLGLSFLYFRRRDL